MKEPIPFPAPQTPRPEEVVIVIGDQRITIRVAAEVTTRKPGEVVEFPGKLSA